MKLYLYSNYWYSSQYEITYNNNRILIQNFYKLYLNENMEFTTDRYWFTYIDGYLTTQDYYVTVEFGNLTLTDIPTYIYFIKIVKNYPLISKYLSHYRLSNEEIEKAVKLILNIKPTFYEIMVPLHLHCSALHFAIYYGHINLTRLLLSKIKLYPYKLFMPCYVMIQDHLGKFYSSQSLYDVYIRPCIRNIIYISIYNFILQHCQSNSKDVYNFLSYLFRSSFIF